MPSFTISMTVELPESYGTFQEVEQKVLAASRLGGQNLLTEILSGYESRFLAQKTHQKKDVREKNIQTLLGKIKIRRQRVFAVFKKKTVTPVDDWLGLCGQMSVGLCDQVVNQCVDKPYRQASEDVKKITGVSRSAMGNWKFVQRHSQREQKKAVKVPCGKKIILRKLEKQELDVCPILGIDPDETYVRPKRKTDKNHALKLAVIYTARKVLHPKTKKKPRRVLVNKQVVMSPVDGKASDLFDKVMHKIVHDYGAHQDTKIICHGDGDPWIKQLKSSYLPQTLNRLDPYHAFEKMRLATGIKDLPRDWLKDFYKNPQSLINKLKILEKELAEKEDQEKVNQLIGYLNKNIDGMRPSGVSKEFKEQHPHMYKRGSGTIESNVFWAVCRRFKGRRMTWSKNGLENLRFLRERHLNESCAFQKVKLSKEQTTGHEPQHIQDIRELLRDL